MSTRATISLEKSNGEIHSIYVHMDGGKMTKDLLIRHYYERSVVEDLISRGSISFLGETLDDYGWDKNSNSNDKGTRYYNRNEKEIDSSKTKVFKDYTEYEQYLKKMYDFGLTYNYLFSTSNEWEEVVA